MKKIVLIIVIALSFNALNAQNAINFDGNDDIIQTNYTGVLASANRTFEAWVYVSTSAPSSNLAILDYGLNAVGSRNTFNVTGSRGLSFISGGTNANIGTSASVVPVNQWVHVAFVLNNAIGYLYVNGVQEGTGSLSTVNTPSGTNLRMGQRVSGGNIPFKGSIDEVRIWDIARTSAEIIANMNSELCTHPNLKAYYKFNQGTAGGSNTGLTTLNDNSGNSYDGTLTGFALSGSTSNWVTGKTLSASGTSTTSTISPVSCGSYTSPSGVVYTSSGTYTDVIPNSQGCDSIITINLTIVNNSTNTISPTSCGIYTSPSGNHTWTSSGTYTDTLANAAGCDSIITVQLTIIQIYTSVLQTNNFLQANQAGANYQWLDCDNNYAIIPGATSQSYTATVDGNYAVEIDINGCTDTSDCFNVIGTGISENDLSSFKLYPNPGSTQLNINFEKTHNQVQLQIKNLIGETIYRQEWSSTEMETIDLELPKGVYFIKVKTDSFERSQKWIRN